MPIFKGDEPSGVIIGPFTKVNTNIAGGPPRAICVGTAGTLNFIDTNGNVSTAYPAQAGYNPIRPAQIKTGGTADDIWLLY